MDIDVPQPPAEVKNEPVAEPAGFQRRAKRPREPLVDAEALAQTRVDASALFGPNSGSRMWLLKVPRFLAEHWTELAKTPGAELGVVTVEPWVSPALPVPPKISV